MQAEIGHKFGDDLELGTRHGLKTHFKMVSMHPLQCSNAALISMRMLLGWEDMFQAAWLSSEFQTDGP